jgi:hypothetical protein
LELYAYKKWEYSLEWPGGTHAAAIPDLRELCPQLVSLQLIFQVQDGPRYRMSLDEELATTDEEAEQEEEGAGEDEDLEGEGSIRDRMVYCRLGRLLPARLQQLQLKTADARSRPGVDCSLYTHLTALSSLTLDSVGMVNTEQLVGMSGLQQLKLRHIGGVVEDLPSLASKLVEVWDCSISPATLRQLTGLTALALSAGQYYTAPNALRPPKVPEVNPLLSLTSLRHLHIDSAYPSGRPPGCPRYTSNPWLLDGLDSLSNLRSMSIAGDSWLNMAEQVAAATQLTCLYAGFWSGDRCPVPPCPRCCSS